MSASTITVVEPPSLLGKRKRKYVLHLASSPEPTFSDTELPPVASSSKPLLINGSLVANTKKRYKCTHGGCGKAYSKPSRLEEHERSHSGERPFVCDTCSKSYLRESHLHAHIRSHLPQSDRPLACSEPNCEKRFWTAQHLNAHIEWHNGAKPFVCDETDCPEAFAKHHQLRTHKCTVHAPPGTKPYQCDHEGCTQSFSTNQHLRTHSKVHNEKRYTCSHAVCLAAETIHFYPTWTALQHHNRTAHPPTCLHPTCNGTVFASQKSLRAHQKLHEQQAIEAEIDAIHDEDEQPRKKRRRGGEVGRDWKCDVDGCTKDFKSKQALTTHNNVTHLGRRDHICPREGCGQTFGYKHLLQRHLAKHDATSSSSSDEDDAAPQTKMDIDTITGKQYAQRRKATHVLDCPYPNWHVLGPQPSSSSHAHADEPACEYVFSRAYDLRRHLQSVHDVVVDKESVSKWVDDRRRSRVSKDC
ncbi:transcription factor iiia [Roridomyces roridus]|uniref:Transcription factor iiia n=1 Tax=Roridomyces roridus TaxID=1738132 RepID=A0AAD7CG50_9AGAR|nr:transcription factor iiia [Roridomyces roridus]